MKKYIGGFYELELPGLGSDAYHDAVALSTGRACMSYLLEAVDVQKIYLPLYACYALYEPFILAKVDIEYYSIDQLLEPDRLPRLERDEYFVYIDYFGLKSEYAASLYEHYQQQLILDNTHSFFIKTPPNCFAFTSARKYFGVPDGAYLYCPSNVTKLENVPRHENASAIHNVLRMEGKQESSYQHYLEYESSLDCSLRTISSLSELLLSHVDYESVRKKRIENFEFLADQLSAVNQFQPSRLPAAVPFCYPFLPAKNIEKQVFYRDNVFVPTLWPDVLERLSPGQFEYDFTQRLLPLPVDHRYGCEEMKKVADLVLANI